MRNFKSRLKKLEATRVIGLIDSYRRTLELTDIETGITALEADLANSSYKAL